MPKVPQNCTLTTPRLKNSTSKSCATPLKFRRRVKGVLAGEDPGQDARGVGASQLQPCRVSRRGFHPGRN